MLGAPRAGGYTEGMSMTKPITPTVSDGRVQRSLNSRQKIMDAMFAYCDEGNLIPTAQEVANRAGVGLRTVFRHFSDMESLFIEMNAQLYARAEPMFTDLDRSGTLDERIAGVIALRGRLYDEIGPYIRSTLAQIWRYEALQSTYGRVVRQLRADLMAWLPELEDKGDAVRLEVETLCSFECWDRLRRYNEVPRARLEGHLNTMITAALTR